MANPLVEQDWHYAGAPCQPLTSNVWPNHMKRIPYDVRVDYWKFQFAKLCFIGAQALVERLNKEPLDRGDPLLAPLMLSTIVHYARPFKQRQPFRFPTSMIPEGLVGMHNYLITLRDKSIAHMDTDGPKIDDNVTNKLVMQVLSTGEMHLAMELPTPSPAQYDEMLQLTRVLREKAQYQVSKIWKKYMRKEPVSSGRYEVNLAKGDAELLIPYVPWCETLPQKLGGQPFCAQDAKKPSPVKM